MSNLNEEQLLCPITMELFNDPINVPCCGQTFSRQSLIDHSTINKNCPMYRGNLSNLDLTNIKKNIIVANLVDIIKNKKIIRPKK